MKAQLRMTLAALIMSVLIIGCGSGGGGSSSAPAPENNDPVAATADVSGVVEKGPVVGGTLNVYSLNEDGTTKLLKSTTTEDLGKYGVKGLELDSELYLFEAVLEGADIEDEVSGEYYKGKSGEVMHAVVTKEQVMAGIVNITPFSTMAFRMAELLGNGDYLDQGVTEANDKVAKWVGSNHLEATSQGELKTALTTMSEKVNETGSLGVTLQQLLSAVQVSADGVYISSSYTVDMAEVCAVVNSDCEEATNFADTQGATAPIWFLDEAPILPDDGSSDDTVDPDVNPLRTYHLDEYPASQDNPEVWDADTYLVAFVDDATKTNYSAITNFGLDDSLSFELASDQEVYVYIFEEGTDVLFIVQDLQGNPGPASEVTIEGVNPQDLDFLTVADFNKLAVGNVEIHGGHVVYPTMMEEIGGTLEAYEQLSVTGADHLLSIEPSLPSAVEVSGYSTGDAIEFQGITEDEISVSSSNGDVEFFINKNGVTTSLILKDIVEQDAIIYDLESFNALDVGDATVL